MKKWRYISLALIAMGLGGFLAQKARADEPSLQVLKLQDTVYARSQFSSQYDIVITMAKGRNGQFDFQRTGLVKVDQPMTEATCKGGELVHACSDDSAPWNLNGTHIGANHGWAGVMQITSAVHGLAAPQDLGTAWIDEKGAKFYLIKVLDQNQLWMMPDNLGSADRWKFHAQISGSKLTLDRAERKLDVQKVVKNQLVPACQIKTQQYLINGDTPLADGTVVTCRYLQLVEEYDIVNPAAVLELVKAHPGQEVNVVDPALQSLLTNKITYRLEPFGGCSVEHRSKANMSFDLGYMGFIQTRILTALKDDELRYYIPRTLRFEVNGLKYDFRSIQDLSSRPPTALHFGASYRNIESPERQPDRFIQFLRRKQGGQERVNVAYAFGYSTSQGLTVPAERAANTANSLVIHTSSKSYPSAIDQKMGRIKAGNTFHCLAYRKYFDPSVISSIATSAYWRPEGEAYWIYVDYHQPVESDVLKLPAFLQNRTVSIVESSDSIKLLSGNTVPSSGIKLAVDGNYGFIVLRLDKGVQP